MALINAPISPAGKVAPSTERVGLAYHTPPETIQNAAAALLSSVTDGTPMIINDVGVPVPAALTQPRTDNADYDPHEEKYVVLHDGIASWKRGDVIGSRDFVAAKADVNRLLRLNAIRTAMIAERHMRRVALANMALPTSYDQQIADMKRHNELLVNRITEVEGELARATQQLNIVKSSTEQPKVLTEIITAKDAQLSDTVRMLNDRNATIANLEQGMREMKRDQENAKGEIAALHRKLEMAASAAVVK